MRVHRWIADLDLPPLLRLLETVEEVDLDTTERRWIKWYSEAGAELLNSTEGGTVLRGPLTPEHRARLSAAHKGKTLPPEHRAKISATLRGREFSPEWRAKISIAQKGSTKSTETKAKMSAAQKKPKSPETRARMSTAQAARKGWKHTPETRNKMSAMRKGRPWSDARRAAQSTRYTETSASALTMTRSCSTSSQQSLVSDE